MVTKVSEHNDAGILVQMNDEVFHEGLASVFEVSCDGCEELRLQHDHNHYYQVQGVVAITKNFV